MTYKRLVVEILACAVLFDVSLTGPDMRAQSAPTSASADQEKVESDYAAMLARVQQGDTSIDFRAFRSAGAQKSGPRASLIELGERQAFVKLAVAGDWAGALTSAKQALERNYASPMAHYDAMVACQKLQQPDEAALHERVLKALLESIRQSGDGKSAESAYFVVTDQEERVFLARALHLNEKSQSLVVKGGHHFDRLQVVDPATNQPQDIWFNADFDFGAVPGDMKPKPAIPATPASASASTAQDSPGQEAPAGHASVSQSADPIAILKQAALIYGAASSLQLEGVKMYERHDEFIDTITRTPFLLILTPDNRYRQESRSAAGTDLQVCDGLTNWHYMARTRKYSSTPGTPDPNNLFNSRIDLRFLNEHLITAELLRQETLQTGNGDHLCDVIQAHYERTQQPRNVDFGNVLYWVDHSSYLVWKTRTQVDTELGQSGAKASGFETTIYNDVQLNVNLQAETFTFVPPPGATPQNVGKVDGREALLGRPAPDFTLRDLEGNPIQLSALKGRVVLLDFWATWCGPCRSTMPKLNSLFKKFRKRDVAVLGVDMHEDQQTVRGFVSKNRYEYPVLLSPRGDPVFDNYFARAIPTLVVIDKNGLVADYKVGYGSETEEMLRDDLVRVLSKEYVAPKPVAAPTSAVVGKEPEVRVSDALLRQGNEAASKDAVVLLDEFANASVGNAHGVSWSNAIGNHGAVFSSANASRIEYPGKIAAAGTLEFWINVASGYKYDNFAFIRNSDSAMVFSTDAQGGDVTWPGTTKLFVSRNGDVSLIVAEHKYDKPPASPVVAQGTSFRFGEWHAIGFSVGSTGQYIMVDGKVVASAPTRAREMGCAGTHQAPADIPTIGETVSHFWAYHRYEGGFEGIVARFRASAKEQDWSLARGLGD